MKSTASSSWHSFDVSLIAWTISTTRSASFLSWSVIKSCLATCTDVSEMIATIHTERNQIEREETTPTATATPLLEWCVIQWQGIHLLSAILTMNIRNRCFRSHHISSFLLIVLILLSTHYNNCWRRSHHHWLGCIHWLRLSIHWLRLLCIHWLRLLVVHFYFILFYIIYL